MARYVIVKNGTEIINVVEWDGIAPWAPSEGCVAILESDLPQVAPKASDPSDFIPD